jgi:hypothetical protein
MGQASSGSCRLYSAHGRWLSHHCLSIRQKGELFETYRMQMIAIIESMLNVRTEDSKPRYDLAAEEPVLQD